MWCGSAWLRHQSSDPWSPVSAYARQHYPQDWNVCVGYTGDGMSTGTPAWGKPRALRTCAWLSEVHERKWLQSGFLCVTLKALLFCCWGMLSWLKYLMCGWCNSQTPNVSNSHCGRPVLTAVTFLKIHRCTQSLEIPPKHQQLGFQFVSIPSIMQRKAFEVFN